MLEIWSALETLADHVVHLLKLSIKTQQPPVMLSATGITMTSKSRNTSPRLENQNSLYWTLVIALTLVRGPSESLSDALKKFNYNYNYDYNHSLCIESSLANTKKF